MILIDHRPPQVQFRIASGHVGGDRIPGVGNCSAVGVLVDGTTRFTFLCHLPQKGVASVLQAFERMLAPLPVLLRRILTYD